jgi:hypothetical protein
MKNNAHVTGGKPITVCWESISNDVNPLVAFYDHERSLLSW